MRKILTVGCLRLQVRNKEGSMREVRFGLGYKRGVSLLFICICREDGEIIPEPEANSESI